MSKLSKRFFQYGAGALVLGMLLVGGPRAAHAINATLVQVTNTPANPAVTQSANTQAVQLVELSTNPYDEVVPGSFLTQLAQISPDGTLSNSDYSVPAKVFLIITSVDITSDDGSGNPCTGPNEIKLYVPIPYGQIMKKRWLVAEGQGTAHFSYPSGIVFVPGAVPNFYSGGSCFTSLQMHGYYSTN